MEIVDSANPLPIKTIILAVDFLESSRLALDYAIGFALKYSATLLMVHAIELPQPAKEAEILGHKRSMSRIDAIDRLDALATGVRRVGVRVETCTMDGEPCNVLVTVAHEQRADLLVLGTHGVHRGLSHLLLGSNVEKLLMSSPCPTLTIGRHVLSGVDLKLRFDEVLYVSDFSAEAKSAAPVALLLGRDFGAPIDVCQMLPEAATSDPILQERLSSEYFEAMRKILPEADHYWITPTLNLENGTMVDQVLERALNNHAGIIVLGVRPEALFARHLRTSFAYKLLAHAPCPILTVRHP